MSHPHHSPLLWGANAWPDELLDPGQGQGRFGADVRAYYGAVLALSDALFELFALALGLPRAHFAPLTDKGMDSLNMLHYPPLAAPAAAGSDREQEQQQQQQQEQQQQQLGIGEHTDFECFTLLAMEAGGEAGLEILHPATRQWQRVPAPADDAFVLNVGDMLSRWSDDELRSTVHRAVRPRGPGARDRYALAFFRGCNYDTMLAPLRPGAPPSAKYPVVMAGEHMISRISEANAPNV